MDVPEELRIPSAADEEALAAPIVSRLAEIIGGLAAADGLVSPRRFETAMSVADAAGKLLGEPSLLWVLTLRALSSPPPLRTAILALRPAADSVPAPTRAELLRALSELLRDARPPTAALAPDLAAALDVPLPEHLRPAGAGVFNAIGSLTDRALRLVRAEEPLVAAARDFATDFGDAQLVHAVTEARRTGDRQLVIRAVNLALGAFRERVTAIALAAEDQEKALGVAQQLDRAADQIEQVARQRHAAISRRAVMLKRHLREDLNALAEDAAEEFEADFRRLAETRKGWFNSIDTTDLNDRMVVKNLERRYRNLARRYQDQLDLLEREVSEFCDEFTRVGDDALSPLARHEFRAVLPDAALQLRVKTAADRASNRTLVAGAAGGIASGAAVHTGLLTAGAVLGATVTPVGAVVLGGIALAGVWKMFASPGERRRRDLRQRAQTLQDNLREEVMANLPRFEQAVDAVVDRFRKAAVPDIAQPRIEAARLREIAAAHRTIARNVVEAANNRAARLLELMKRAELGDQAPSAA